MSFYRHHPRVTIKTGFGLTKQSFKDECDINNILKQYRRTGVLQHISARQSKFEHLPTGMEFQDAMNAVIEAEAAFADLPSKVRARFNNDPGTFLSALEDPAHHDELVQLGVLKPPRPADTHGQAGTSHPPASGQGATASATSTPAKT